MVEGIRGGAGGFAHGLGAEAAGGGAGGLCDLVRLGAASCNKFRVSARNGAFVESGFDPPSVIVENVLSEDNAIVPCRPTWDQV